MATREQAVDSILTKAVGLPFFVVQLISNGFLVAFFEVVKLSTDGSKKYAVRGRTDCCLTIEEVLCRASDALDFKNTIDATPGADFEIMPAEGSISVWLSNPFLFMRSVSNGSLILHRNGEVEGENWRCSLIHLTDDPTQIIRDVCHSVVEEHKRTLQNA